MCPRDRIKLKPLELSGRLEAPHLALPLTRRLVGDLDDKVLPMIPTISDYYRAAIEALKKEVEATADADVNAICGERAVLHVTS